MWSKAQGTGSHLFLVSVFVNVEDGEWMACCL